MNDNREADLKAEVDRLRGALADNERAYVKCNAERDNARRAAKESALNGVAEQRRAESAEAALVSEREAHAGLRERLEALADEWGNRWDVPEPGRFDPSARHMRLAATDLRRSLAAEPAEATASRPPETSGAGSIAPVAAEEGGEQKAGEAKWPKFDRHSDGFRCYGWVGSRWHNPKHYAAHIHCDEPGCVAECQPCSVGDGFHRSSPHKPAEHEACDCAPSGSDEQGNRPATPDANGVHDTKGGEGR